MATTTTLPRYILTEAGKKAAVWTPKGRFVLTECSQAKLKMLLGRGHILYITDTKADANKGEKA